MSTSDLCWDATQRFQFFLTTDVPAASLSGMLTHASNNDDLRAGVQYYLRTCGLRQCNTTGTCLDIDAAMGHAAHPLCEVAGDGGGELLIHKAGVQVIDQAVQLSLDVL